MAISVWQASGLNPFRDNLLYDATSWPTSFVPNSSSGSAANQPAGLLPGSSALFQSPIPQYFAGSTVAGLTDFQNQAFQNQLNAARLASGQAQNYLGTYEDYLGQGPQMNPYLREVAWAQAQEAMRNFNRNTLPALRGTAVSAGGLGGSRQALSEAIASSDMQTILGEQQGRLLSQGFQDTQNRYLQALLGGLPLYQYAAQIGQLPGQLKADYGELQQRINAARMMEDLAEWQYYRDQPGARMSQYAASVLPISGLGGNTATSGGFTNTTTASDGGSGLFGTLGGALTYLSPYLGSLGGS